MNEDRLTYDELLQFNDEMIKDEKEFDEELRSRIAKQKFIIVGTPTFNSSEFEKVFQSAIDDGHEVIYIDSISENISIHAEYIENENIFFGISRDTFEPMIFENNITHNLNKEYEEKQQYKEFAINELKELPKKKKTFQENFGYVKRKFR